MGTARDIALIFLSLEALVIVLVPVLLISALAYGVYRLTGLTREYLRIAVSYAQQAYDYVEDLSKKITAPFIKMHTRAHQVTTMAQRLKGRERANGQS